MASKALQIRNAVIALLQSPALAGIGSAGVTVDPDYAFRTADLPAVAVYLGDEQPSQRNVIGAMDRSVMVTVKVISKGDDAFAAGDALVVEAHSRILADISLGGLAFDISEQGIRRARDVLEVPVAVTELDLAVEYRTNETSLEA